MTAEQSLILISTSLFILALQFSVARKHGVTSPISIYLSLWWSNILAFWFMVTFADHAPAFRSYWFLSPVTNTQVYRVVYYGIGFTVIAMLAYALTTHLTRHIAPMTDSSSRQAELTNRLAVTASTFAKWPLVVITILMIIHALDTDWSQIWYYQEYLQSRSAEGLGIEWMPAWLFHQLDLFLGVIAALLFALTVHTRKPLLAILSGSVLAYISLLALGFHSRMGAMVLGFSAFAFQYLRGTRGVSSYAIILFILSVTLYVAALIGRGLPFHGLAAYAVIFQAAQIFEIGSFEFFVTVLNSVLPGGTVIAHGCDQFVTPTPRYEISSIIPGMSSLDGYEGERRHIVPRVTIFQPLSAFGELCHFSHSGVLLYSSLFLIALIILQTYWHTNPGPMRLMVVAPAYLGFIMSHIYLMRMPNRMIVLSVVIVSIVLIYRIWRHQQSQNRLSVQHA